MSVWTKIKRRAVEGKPVGTLAYNLAVAQAAYFFVDIMDDLKHPAQEKVDFNEDTEIALALALSMQIDRLDNTTVSR